MEHLRAKVAKKTAGFMRVAQQPPPIPPAPADAAPAPTPAAPAPRAPTKPVAPPPVPGVPAAPAAPGAPPAAPPPSPRDMAEQNVQKQVEKDKMQEVKLDKVQQAITQNNEKMESLVDAIVNIKQVIETTLLGEPGIDDKLKKLKDKQEQNKTTPDEFGLDKDNLIVSKEEGNMATAKDLRQARKERLASDLKYHSEKYDPEGLKFHDAEPEEKKYKQQVPAPQITKVKEDKVPDLFRIAMDLSDDESKWSVVDKKTEEVLYEINKSEANSENFNTKAFAAAVIADMKALGLVAAMEKHSAIPFLDKPKLPEKKEEIKEKLEEKKDLLKPEKKEDKIPDLKLIKKELPLEEKGSDADDAAPASGLTAKQAEQDVRRRFMRAFRLALSAQQKNLIDNPLKAAWFKTLTAMSVENPRMVIEATFTNAALDQFEVALQKTDEYLNLSDEAFIEAESTVGDFNVAMSDDEPSVVVPRQSALAMQERAKKASLVVSTASDADSQDRSSMIAQALPMPKLAGISRFGKWK